MSGIRDQSEWWIATYFFAILFALVVFVAVATWRSNAASERLGVACVQAGGSWDNKAEKCEGKR